VHQYRRTEAVRADGGSIEIRRRLIRFAVTESFPARPDLADDDDVESCPHQQRARYAILGLPVARERPEKILGPEIGRDLILEHELLRWDKRRGVALIGRARREAVGSGDRDSRASSA